MIQTVHLEKLVRRGLGLRYTTIRPSPQIVILYPDITEAAYWHSIAELNSFQRQAKTQNGSILILTAQLTH